MRYRLVVLSHGQSTTLGRALASFREHVTPVPAEAYMHPDGAAGHDVAYNAMLAADWTGWVFGGTHVQQGFCASTRECMEEAGSPGVEWAYYLEHDFLHLRDVDLEQLVAVMDARPHLAQMALRRTAVNEAEKAAGDYVRLRPDAFEARADEACRSWLEHSGWWTTNPSLFRRALAASEPWPDGPNCEGLFGFQLRERRPETRFGIWGDLFDAPWVEHVGTRNGFGY